jgi:hypothetical protein
MAKDWNIKKGDVIGGDSGQELDGSQIRVSEDGKHYEFLAVVSRTTADELPTGPFVFPPFAYNGLVWNIGVDSTEWGPDKSEIHGGWGNNKRHVGPPGDEGGTYTGQSGPGVPEESGEEDAASASA